MCDGTLVWFKVDMTPNPTELQPVSAGILECSICGYFQCTNNPFHESHNSNDFLLDSGTTF